MRLGLGAEALQLRRGGRVPPPPGLVPQQPQPLGPAAPRPAAGAGIASFGRVSEDRPAPGGPLSGRSGSAAPNRRPRRTRSPRRSGSSSPQSAPRLPATRRGRCSPWSTSRKNSPVRAMGALDPADAILQRLESGSRKGRTSDSWGSDPSWGPSPPARRRPAPYPPAARAPGRRRASRPALPTPRLGEEEQNGGGDTERPHKACSCEIGAEIDEGSRLPDHHTHREAVTSKERGTGMLRISPR